MTELERVSQAEEYFRRYDQMEAAIVQNRENQEYLKTYIHDERYVEENFGLKKKRLKCIITGACAGVALFVVLMILIGLLANFKVGAIVGGVLGLFLAVGSSIFLISLQHYKYSEAQAEQLRINEGITEQIEILKKREPEIVKSKESYYEGLKERIDFMDVSEMKYIGEIRKMLEDGSAQTCEDAVAMVEQKALLDQLGAIMEKSEQKKVYTEEENKERFGDPLALIKKKKRSFFGRNK